MRDNGKNGSVFAMEFRAWTMRLRMSAMVAVAGAWLAVMPGTLLAQPAMPKDIRVNAEAIEARVQALVASGDPKDLWAAGYWHVFADQRPDDGRGDRDNSGRSRQAMQWIRQAAIEGSEDVWLAKIALVLCLGEPKSRCDVERALRTAETQAADDMFVQNLVLLHMSNKGDAEDKALRRFMAATRYVDYARQEQAVLAGAMQGVTPVLPLSVLSTGFLPETDIEADLGPVANVAAAQMMAGWMSLTSLWPLLQEECPADGEDDVHILGKCRDMLMAMTASTSLQELMFVYSRLPAYSRTAQEKRRWEAKHRQIFWVIEQLAAQGSGTASAPLPVKASEYWTWVADEGEWEAMRRLLISTGLPDQPPKEWQLPEGSDI